MQEQWNLDFITDRKKAITSNLKKNRNLIDQWGGLADLPTRMEGKTVVIIGAGSSLNFDILRRYQSQGFVPITVDMAYRPVVLSGIKPDYVFTCETTPLDYFNGLEHYGILISTCFAAAARQWRGAMRFYNWIVDDPEYDAIWKQAGLELGSLATGGTVITHALAFALGCNCAGIVMMGNDLGYTDRYYAPGSISQIKRMTGARRLNTRETIEQNTIRRATVNSITRAGVKYKTTSQFLITKQWIEKLMARHSKQIYDLSMPGVVGKNIVKIS